MGITKITIGVLGIINLLGRFGIPCYFGIGKPKAAFLDVIAWPWNGLGFRV